MIKCSNMLLFVYFYGWSALIIKKLCLLDFFYFSVPDSQRFIQPDKPPVISRMGMPYFYGWSALIIKKLCLLDFFYFSVPDSQRFIQPDKPPVICRMGMPRSCV